MVKKILAKVYIWFFLFLMYAPILLLVIYSFQDTQYIYLNRFNNISFNLYTDLFKNQEIIDATVNTIIVALASAVVATIIGTLGAIGIYYLKPRSKKVINTVSNIPVLNAEIVTALSLTILFVAIGSKNFITLLIGHVVLTVPFVVLSVIPKLKQLDPNTYEAALDLGASPSYALVKVILPEIIPGIFSGFMLAITLSLDDYIITAYTKNTNFTTLSTYIYGVTAKGPLPAELRALTAILFFGILIGLIVYNFSGNRRKNLKKERRRV